MTENLQKWVQCPFCKKDLLVYWGSFLGSGKKCSRCGNIVHRDQVKVVYST